MSEGSLSKHSTLNMSGSSGNKARHITIVCCHGIWKGRDGLASSSVDTGVAATADIDSNVGIDDAEWFLEPFQVGEGKTFRQHVLEGMRVAQEKGGELWFSGGPTKRPRTDLSEAESYLNLCRALQHGRMSSVDTTGADGQRRYTLRADVYATDSLQNVLFPILQSVGIPSFRTLAAIQTRGSSSGRVLITLTIVSHAFKRSRFLDQHMPALGFTSAWVEQNVDYVGIDPDTGDEARAAFLAGESKARSQWADDEWALGNPLRDKRVVRGWSSSTAEELLGQIGLEIQTDGTADGREEDESGRRLNTSGTVAKVEYQQVRKAVLGEGKLDLARFIGVSSTAADKTNA